MGALESTFQRKCAYCETALKDGTGVVDRFRPRQNATGVEGTAPDHYWWLAWEWRNLYLACNACSRAKGTAFPVDGRRAPIECPYQELRDVERPLLLDPCEDDPESLFLYEESGRVVADEVRAMTTIDLLSLNRSRLVAERRSAIANARGRLTGVDGLLRSGSDGQLPGVVDTLLDLISTDAPYSAVRRQCVRTWAAEQPDRLPPDPQLRAFVNSSQPRATLRRIENARVAYAEHLRAIDDDVGSGGTDRELGRTRFIELIELANIRGIEHLELRALGYESAGAPCLALVGENGTGKTTILQAVALALMGPAERRRLGLRPAQFLRHGAREGLIRVFLSSREEAFELRLVAGNDDFIDVRPSVTSVPVMAYGPTRLLPRRGTGRLRSKSVRVDNLFDPHAALTSPASWLASLKDDDWFRRTAVTLRGLLPVGDDDQIVRGPPVRVRMAGSVVPFPALSAGYQAILALAADVMRFGERRWGARSAGELAETASGILIIDEIDAHLHPRWKLRVLSDLRMVFPHLQILVTTHDPLTLRGLDRGEVAVLARDADDVVRVTRDLPSPKSLRVDQLLTSEFFGLISTRDAATDALLREYQSLVAHPPISEHALSRLRELESELSARQLLGSDARERLFLQAADQYLGRYRERLRDRRPQDQRFEAFLAALWERSREPRE